MVTKQTITTAVQCIDAVIKSGGVQLFDNGQMEKMSSAYSELVAAEKDRRQKIQRIGEAFGMSAEVIENAIQAGGLPADFEAFIEAGKDDKGATAEQ